MMGNNGINTDEGIQFRPDGLYVKNGKGVEVKLDAVSHPSHYTQGGVEVIDIIAQTVAGYDDPFVGHCVGTATKYLNRAPYKHASPLEDLRKSRAYIEFAIEHIEAEEPKR